MAASVPAMNAAHTAHNVLILQPQLHPQALAVWVHRAESLLLFVLGGRAGQIPTGQLMLT